MSAARNLEATGEAQPCSSRDGEPLTRVPASSGPRRGRHVLSHLWNGVAGVAQYGQEMGSTGRNGLKGLGKGRTKPRCF